MAEASSIVRVEGVEALTMRRLADACGVTPMALYHHVSDKDDVLERVLDEVAGEAAGFAVEGDATGQLLDFSENLYRVMIANPGVGRLWTSRGITVPNMALLTERFFGLLADCGITGPEAAATLDTLVVHIVGGVAYNLSRPPGIRYELVKVELPTPTPLLDSYIDAYARRDPDAQFRRSLEQLWNGITSTKT